MSLHIGPSSVVLAEPLVFWSQKGKMVEFFTGVEKAQGNREGNGPKP